MGMGTLNKVIMLFPAAFWDNTFLINRVPPPGQKKQWVEFANVANPIPGAKVGLGWQCRLWKWLPPDGGLQRWEAVAPAQAGRRCRRELQAPLAAPAAPRWPGRHAPSTPAAALPSSRPPPPAPLQVLVAFNAGSTAVTWESLSDAEMVRRASDVLRALYPKTYTAPLASFVTRWASDPYARGAYSYAAKGSDGDDNARLAATEGGRVFFAGGGGGGRALRCFCAATQRAALGANPGARHPHPRRRAHQLQLLRHGARRVRERPHGGHQGAGGPGGLSGGLGCAGGWARRDSRQRISVRGLEPGTDHAALAEGRGAHQALDADA
jgi:hypothetical protein